MTPVSKLMSAAGFPTCVSYPDLAQDGQQV